MWTGRIHSVYAAKYQHVYGMSMGLLRSLYCVASQRLHVTRLIKLMINDGTWRRLAGYCVC
jgi:hypothetical protein